MGAVIQEQMMTTIQDTAATVVYWTPRLLSVVLLFVLVLLATKLVERTLRAMLTRVRLGVLIERVRLTDTLRRVCQTQPLEVLLPRVVYYLLLFLAARTLADTLGLGPVSDAIGAFLAFLPNVLSAVLILLLGSVVANLAGQMVSRASRESGIDFAASLGSLVSALILFVLGIMAVTQLRIDTEIVRLVIACVLAGVALAFGLSFGLGTRKIFSTGKEIEIRGQRGVLRSITPTQTLLVQSDDTLVAVSNAAFLDDVVKQ